MRRVDKVSETENVMNETIAILGGTGKEGPGLALRWAQAGYCIIIGSRSAEKAVATAVELNARLGMTTIAGMDNNAAARAAEISVLTVVQAAHEEALIGLKDALQGKILVDATARVDFRSPTPPPAPAAALRAQQILGPGVRVVAAFQNVPAHALKKLDQPLESDVLVCADDVDAARQVMALAEAAGMKAIYAGGLENAVIVEGITALLIAINKFYGVKTASIGVTGISNQ